MVGATRTARVLTQVRVARRLNGRKHSGFVGAPRQARTQDLDMDVQEVRELESVQFDVLIAANRAWASDGRQLGVINPSIEFVQALEARGLRNCVSFDRRDPPAGSDF